MNESKNTKKALHASLVSLFLCIVMLIGTTFAWFTDSASTGINKIQAGNLNVELNYWEGTAWKNAENKQLFNYTKWEPGYMEVQGLQVRNAGNLALKWKAAINSTKELSGLADVIDVYVQAGADYKYEKPESREDVAKNWKKVGTLRDFVNGIETTTYGSLEAHETADLGLALVMSTEAGNSYQGMDLGGDITVTILATQDTVENDSFDNQYDAKAAASAEAAALKTKLQTKGGIISLATDIDVAFDATATSGSVPQMWVLKDTVLNLEGKTIGVDKDALPDTAEKYTAFLMYVNGSTMTVNGNGVVDAYANGKNSYCIGVAGNGKLIINDGTYYGATTAIHVYNGTLEINGGFFDMTPDAKETQADQAKYVVNVQDGNWKNGTGSITITGGTFVNFDPSDNPEGKDTTYVAKGYKVVSEEQSNGDIWYTVVKS